MRSVADLVVEEDFAALELTQHLLPFSLLGSLVSHNLQRI